LNGGLLDSGNLAVNGSPLSFLKKAYKPAKKIKVMIE
jgi:hypothetical protein